MMLAEMIEARELRPATIIQRAVAIHFGIRVEEMWSDRRAREVARPRMIAMYLAKELTGYSFHRIGRYFGNRDHTTVMHACRTVPLLCERHIDLFGAVRALNAQLTAQIYKNSEEDNS